MWIKKVTVRHKREDCIWCWSCALIAPRQRIMDHDDGKSTLVGAVQKGKQFVVWQIDEDDVMQNKEAAEACPVKIIYL